MHGLNVKSPLSYTQSLYKVLSKVNNDPVVMEEDNNIIMIKDLWCSIIIAYSLAAQNFGSILL